ncbi:hypothetical protein [Pleomorphomonas sp. JP5]|uniref:hypothetical protein n=1 Tax=Pleomorphomonas sp. JP5 TaxID=2942998 RepID=UPI002043EFF7|nr:hypothetical protein [Pleomorphomonas sp. JP5]MCM5556717.1 hypothetical protein [Pleomorphomonas sp. JP5]
MEAEFAGRIALISESDVGSLFCAKAYKDRVFGLVTTPAIEGEGYATLLLNSRFPDRPIRTNLHGHIERPALIFDDPIVIPEYASMEWNSSTDLLDGSLILSNEGFLIYCYDGYDTSYISVKYGSYLDSISRDFVYFTKWAIFAKNRRDIDPPIFSMDCNNRQ